MCLIQTAITVAESMQKHLTKKSISITKIAQEFSGNFPQIFCQTINRLWEGPLVHSMVATLSKHLIEFFMLATE